jgi:hypothetical protein
MAQKDIWKFYDDWKVHISNQKLFESICQTFDLVNQMDRCTKYYDGGLSDNPIAWDVIVPNESIDDVKKHIKEFD